MAFYLKTNFKLRAMSVCWWVSTHGKFLKHGMLCTNFLYLIFSEAKWPYQEWQCPSIYNTRNRTPFSYLPYPTVIVWWSTGLVSMPPMLSLCPNQTAVISYGPSFPMSLNAVFLSKFSRQLSSNWSETISDKKPIWYPQSEGKGKALES